MLIRAIALSIALLIGMGVIVPMATEQVEAGKKKGYKKKKRSWRGVRKYSKRWWQLYRAQERRKKARAAKRRGMRLRQMRLAKARAANAVAGNTAAAAKTDGAMLPSGDKAPKSWKRGQSSGSELQFRVDDVSGSQVGSAAISVVGPAMGEDSERGRYKKLAGVPTTSLRREVINQMVRENGWVVNDYQKQIGGKKVYVVEAQSQSGSTVNARMFYFTEVGGRIYSVSTNSKSGSAERLAEESEKVIHSLQNGSSTQRAAAKE